MSRSVVQCDSFFVEERVVGSASVCYVGISSLPSMEDMETLRCTLTRMLTEQRMIIHAEHVVSAAIQLPSVEHFKLIASLLAESKLLLSERLVGTVIQTKQLDAVTRLARDAFLLLYRPQRPMSVTESEEESMDCIRSLLGNVYF